MDGLRTNITRGRQEREGEDKTGGPKPREMGNKTSSPKIRMASVQKGLSI